MTEQQLRQKVADIILSWVGAYRGDSTHLKILQIYNSHTPLARGYKVQTGDAYCATTVSACWISAGIAGWTGTECGCDKFIEIAKAKGIWVEDDAYVPKIGDAILYDWEDSGSGDNRGSSDHIGIVTRSSNGSFDVAEGNISGGRVGMRTVLVNGKNIRGFICPDYAAIAKAMSGGEEDKGEMTKEEIQAMIDKAVSAGVTKAVKTANLNADNKITKALDDALGPMIGDYGEIPWKGVREEVGEMVKLGVIDGGTDAEVNPDDVNMRLQDLRVLVVAKRYVLKVLADKFKIIGKIINRR